MSLTLLLLFLIGWMANERRIILQTKSQRMWSLKWLII